MNTGIIQKKVNLYDLLPILDTKDNSFFYLDKDKSYDKLNNLVNKYIVFELITKNGILTIPGKLLKVNNQSLLIRQYDDGNRNTQELWKDNNGTDLFKEFEEEISIHSIRGIEECNNFNLGMEDIDKCIGSICEITSRNDRTITVLIKGRDNLNIDFDYKYIENDNECIGSSSCSLSIIKGIERKQYN